MQQAHRVVAAPLANRFSPHRTRRGMTLIENIVALAVLGVAMSLAGTMMFYAFNESGQALRQGKAALIAQQKMDEAFLHRADLDSWQAKAAAESSLDVETNYYNFQDEKLAAFRWTWRVEPVEGKTGLRKVAVSTYWRRPYGKGNWSSCNLEALMVVPARQTAMQSSKEVQP